VWVSARERERERKREREREKECEYERKKVCVLVFEKERERGGIEREENTLGEKPEGQTRRECEGNEMKI
jgi:hypothetical protein